MEEELNSEGRCLFCEQLLSQKEVGKHMSKHLGEMERNDAGKSHNNYCHIEVEAYEMFLHLLVRGETSMKSIDQFLRKIWLECCGHLSNFGHKNYEIKMKHKVEDVFQPRIKIYHEYDYGDTTRVFLKAHKQYRLNLKENVILLSRNEPLKILCSSCTRNPAVNLCAVCSYNDDAFFCEKCSEKHTAECKDFVDHAEMPIVNSPRLGVCGYTGGRIDEERDGFYKK